MILAGITLFNPDVARLEENISSIYGQVDRVICVDNGSDNIKSIEDCVLKNWKNITIIKNGKNEGIAKALNQMFEFAIEQQYEYVLTLDQDSVCPDNIIEEYNKYLDEHKLGSLCPQCVDRNFKSELNNEDVIEVDKCITSASLVPVSAWNDVGGFNDELFIDFVDHDFCAKLKEHGYRILQIGSVKLSHELGKGKNYSILGVKFTALNHSAMRKYYMVRNWIYYMNEHKDIINLKAEKKSYRLFFLKTLIFEDDKLKKMKHMLKVIRDCIKLIWRIHYIN